MKMIGDLFTGILSKFDGKNIEGSVYTTFVITHTSRNEPDQEFLDSYDAEFGTNWSKCMNNPQWDNIKFSTSHEVNVKFDEMEFKAYLSDLKISQKEVKGELVFKYNLVFYKTPSPDQDLILQSYLNHKEPDDNGKMHLVEYDVELS
jgi:hypothetical protein